MKEDAKSKGTKRKLMEDDTDDQTKVQSIEAREKINRRCKKVMVMEEESTSVDEDDHDSSEKEVSEDICIICGDVGKHRELWLQCCNCSQWAHEACADTERGHFVCDFCI